MQSGANSGDDTPTQAIGPDDDVVPAARVSPDDELKASLLGGRGGKIGRFHILRLLGEGGMGMVFAGYDEELGRKVAIKLLRRAASEDSIGRARLVREAQTLARLSHPNVVTVYDVGEFDRQVYIAMEFVNGETLQSWLQSRRRSWREVVGVFIEAGAGLAVAHAAGILHRDFKPANVLLGEDGRVRVLDFGLALAQDAPSGPPDVLATHVRLREREARSDSVSRQTDGLTAAGSVMGTPPYMAPERFTFARPIDPRADQFGFCVAFFEGLYGARPFPGRTYEHVRAAILRGKIVDPPGPHNVPGWLRKVVLRGLAAEPDDRFVDMNALIVALRRDPERTRKRALVGLAAAAALVGGGYGLAQATAARVAGACSDARVKLHPVWDDRRAEVERALVATGATYAADTWTRVAVRVDHYADAWAAGHGAACMAHARGEQSAVLLDQRMACLDRRRNELTALVDRLRGADRDTVLAAASAVDALIPVEGCADAAVLTAAVPLPEDPDAALRVTALRGRLAEARASLATAKLVEAGTIAAEVVAAARTLGFRPLLAEATALHGTIAAGRSEYEPASKQLEEAVWLADIVHDDKLLADTMAKLIDVLGIKLARFEDALRWRHHADAVVTRLGAANPSHAALLRGFGVIASTQGKASEARELLARALAIDEGLAEPHEESVIRDLLALGITEFQAGNPAVARGYHERALVLGEALYGPNHPDIARILANVGTAAAGMGELDVAVPHFERALAIIERAHGPGHPTSAGTLTNLGTLHAMQERYDLAQPLFERALAIMRSTFGPDHLNLATPMHNLGRIAGERGDLAQAREYHQKALAIRARSLGEDSPAAAGSLLQLGMLAYKEGDLPGATRDIERALAVFVANPEHQNRDSLPEGRFTLARVLRDAGDSERAGVEARRAAAEYRRLDADRYAEQIAEIEAWLAAPPAPRPKKK